LEPLSGAYVHFDGQKGGAITDAFGYFDIKSITAGEYKLKVKYIGYTEYEERIHITGNQVLNIKLTEKSESLKLVQGLWQKLRGIRSIFTPLRKKCG